MTNGVQSLTYATTLEHVNANYWDMTGAMKLLIMIQH